jgi:hypothetical protein
MNRYAAYDDAGIWAIGDTPEAALAAYSRDVQSEIAYWVVESSTAGWLAAGGEYVYDEDEAHHYATEEEAEAAAQRERLIRRDWHTKHCIVVDLRTAPMTYRLAEKVEREGYDYTHPGYSWRVLSDGTLDLDEGAAQ